MDLLSQASDGFRTCDVPDSIRIQAEQHLRRWLTQPEFAPYRPQIEWLIQTKQWLGLLDRFYQILPFGTGGRRGAVGIGPNRMNLWTLAASVQGHCEYLRERFPGIEPLRVVVAYDVRRFEDRRGQYNRELPNPVLHLSSRRFAEQAVGVYVANGIHAHILPENSSRYLATPELSFTIRLLQAHGGLNISASHNPPDDNGGKFYDERGGQPVPPDDQIMADLVDQVTTIRSLSFNEALRSGKVHLLDEAPHRAYIDLCRRQSLVPTPRFDEIDVVFTPLHGVGSMTALEVLQAQGFHVVPVQEQMTPDGQFPNVTQSPNPEVPASMDRAEKLARDLQADLVLATDPDADRLGAMCPQRSSDPAGPWRFLTGNEIAALLTHFKLKQLNASGDLPASPIVITTLVTTRLVTKIARHFGAQVVNNLLVGFKYMADVLWQLEQHGVYEDVTGSPADMVIATEESHGVLLMPQLRDKDAGAAALLMAELALDCKRQGRGISDYLDRLYRQFGYHHTTLANIVLPGIEGKQQMARMLDRLRREPPQQIAGMDITHIEDLQREDCWLGEFKGATDRAARNFLVFELGENARVSLRPSGTEPKAKAYIEVSSPPCAPPTSEEEWERICGEVDTHARHLREEFVQLVMRLAGNQV